MQMSHQALIAILLLSPFVGFLLNGTRFRSQNYVLAGAIATGAVFISFICSVMLMMNLIDADPEHRRLTANFFEWISVGGFKVNAGFVVDQISSIMILIITGVGYLINVL